MGDIFEQAKTARLVGGGSGSGEIEPGSDGGIESRSKVANEADERLTHRRDIEMIGVLTERLANSERRAAEARREVEEALVRLQEEQNEHQLAIVRIEQLELDQRYLRAECEVLRAAAQRTFYAGSSSVYLNLGLVDQFEREFRNKRARRERAEDLIRRYVPRSLRKHMRKLLFGKS